MAWSLFSTSDDGGVTPYSWAESVLSAGGWPDTSENAQSLIAWALNEGGGGTYNPLNSTLQMRGSSAFNSVGVQDYTSWGQGISATVDTLNNGYYPEIVSDLNSGGGIGSGAAANLLTWSGSGYSTISANWDDAAGYMGGKGTEIAAQPGGDPGKPGQSGGVGIDPILAGIWEGIFGPSGGLADLVGAGAGQSAVAQSIYGLAAPFVKIAEKLDWFFYPNHWIRILCGFAGAAMTGYGVWGMFHVGSSTSPITIAGKTPPGMPNFHLPMSIAATGLGAILLFIAFHNLPGKVDTFPGLLGYLADEVKAGGQAPS